MVTVRITRFVIVAPKVPSTSREPKKCPVLSVNQMPPALSRNSTLVFEYGEPLRMNEAVECVAVDGEVPPSELHPATNMALQQRIAVR
jgi:hypothetical protein